MWTWTTVTRQPSSLFRRALGPLGLAVCVLATGGGRARADNAPEKEQRRVEEDVLPKVLLACGVQLTVKYDGESLRKNNKDIGYDQTDGANECNEPLRYLWYACQSPAGKAAVKVARISQLVCKGVSGATGALTLSAGVMTVGRAFEETHPYLRSRKQFEALVKVALPLRKDENENPYNDEAWAKLALLPNPVTSTTTYCLVKGQKVAFDDYVYDPFCRRKEDAAVKCLKDGETVIDLDIRKGRKTGTLTLSQGNGSRRVTYRDDKEDGEQKTVEGGKVKALALFSAGERVWEKQLHPNGRLASYSRKLKDGTAEISLGQDGRVYRLRCLPTARDDKELRRWCGFEGAVTTSIYDGTGKVTRVETWKDGVIQKETAGTSDYAARSEVSFKDGKKQGTERLLAKNGKLASTITWDRGVKDGKEIAYADDGQKVVEVIVWKAGEMTLLTDFFLNGNPKLKEVYETPKKKQVKTFWDTGKLSAEGVLVRCDVDSFGYRYRDWCEDGVYKSYFENGAPEEVATFQLGKRAGTTRTWWQNGRPASVEEYAADVLTKAKRWNEDGKLVSDDEYEPDGSRKLGR